jgi:signal transduction histidine kinase
VLKQRVQLARRKILHDPTFDALLSELQEMLETTMSDVRRFSRALRPIYLEEAGLVAALETLTRDMSRAELHIAFEVTGEVRRLAPEVELALYRIVQESLNNVVKHACASSAHVSVAYNSSDLSIRVEDNGVGFDAPERATGLVVAGHYGLMGMQERAQLVGAKLSLRSQPGKGTQVEAQIPL